MGDTSIEVSSLYLIPDMRSLLHTSRVLLTLQFCGGVAIISQSADASSFVGRDVSEEGDDAVGASETASSFASSVEIFIVLIGIEQLITPTYSFPSSRYVNIMFTLSYSKTISTTQ